MALQILSSPSDAEDVVSRLREAIAHLMKGDSPPVHAIDRLETRVP